jgi:hypothetical protein
MSIDAHVRPPARTHVAVDLIRRSSVAPIGPARNRAIIAGEHSPGPLADRQEQTHFARCTGAAQGHKQT